MYKIGDKISHPVHGAGIVQSVEVKEIFGEEKSFYNICIPQNKMKLMVSTEKADEIGIRKIVDKEEMANVLKELTVPFKNKKTNWIERSRRNVEKIKSGNIIEVAEVVKELYAIDNEKGLSASEKRMYNNARQILLSELALVNNLNNEQAEMMMKEALNKTIKIK